MCRDLFQNEGIQSLTLCPVFKRSKVSLVANAVGEGVPINVALSYVTSVMATNGILAQEDWFL